LFGNNFTINWIESGHIVVFFKLKGLIKLFINSRIILLNSHELVSYNLDMLKNSHTKYLMILNQVSF